MALASTAASHVDVVAATVRDSMNAATSIVAASWRRSMIYYGLDPAKPSAPMRLEAPQLALSRERNGKLLEVARPCLDRLFQTAGRAGCCVALTDADGMILETSATEGDRKTFSEWGLVEGAVWNEASEGTNGIGTCLAEKRPVIIFQNQHFRAKNIAMSCMGAPIHDASGELIAVLDVSNCRNDLSQSFAQVLGAVVTESARTVEADLFRASHPGARIIMAEGHGPGGVSLLAVDEDNLVVGASRLARRNLGLTAEALSLLPSLSEVLEGAEGQRGLGQAEKAEIRRALVRRKGNVTAAAKDLGISRATMYRRMSQYRLTAEAAGY
ncbi:GAF domain-containing protein [Roseibium litorale]|uniref:Sigma-54-dependent Fis family transcriptional regulator n=1 Tax=Roseibium litorale TaxID=2803841 RepID=A0ABR9CNG8_9HYPH|nr:GAF domain-containing protein [Roseibium litorale]MBD8892367.1 sigma-54-dependent Fis family transcriptional regulator [Roseibium litorale]